MVAWPAVGLKGICFMVSAPAVIPPSQLKGGGEGRRGGTWSPEFGYFLGVFFCVGLSTLPNPKNTPPRPLTALKMTLKLSLEVTKIRKK